MSQFAKQKDVTREDAGAYNAEGNVAGALAAKLGVTREKQREEYESKKRAIDGEKEKERVGRVDAKFTKQAVVAAEQKFNKATYGLKTREEYLGLRDALGNANGEGENVTTAASNTTAGDAKPNATAAASNNKATTKRRKVANLSFGEEEEEDEEQEQVSSRGRGRGKGRGKAAKVSNVRRIIKNPNVRTDFLPDRHREQAELKQVEKLKEEWTKAQESVKCELVQVTYSYWDGAGHRRTISIPKGSTIGRFLELVRQDLMNADFPELAKVSAANLMYVKEDIIIPHSYSFYDLIISKARGKSGPLFNFDVHEDVRMSNDVRVEKDESHPGKICERHWFERNKHIFPASRWEVYDPNVIRDKYTIHGGEVRKNKRDD